MEIGRRGLLAGILAAACGPAIVRASSLMPAAGEQPVVGWTLDDLAAVQMQARLASVMFGTGVYYVSADTVRLVGDGDWSAGVAKLSAFDAKQRRHGLHMLKEMPLHE